MEEAALCSSYQEKIEQRLQHKMLQTLFWNRAASYRRREIDNQQ